MGEGGEGFAKDGNEAMETPERSRNGKTEASIGKFEDSPIFSFINSLSPIKPVKPTHVSQSFNPLSFASLPSVFTSPQVNPPRESRFLRRPQLSDSSKPEISSGDRIAVTANKENVDPSKKEDEQKENPELEALDGETTGEISNECSKLVAEFVENISRKTSAVNLEGICQIDPNKGTMSCNWGSLIPDASDLLTLESQNGIGFDKKPVDPATSFYTRIKNAVQNMHSTGTVVSGDQVGHETLSARLGEEIEIMENAAAINSSEKMDYEQFSGFYRGIRRRCLVFEMTGASQAYLQETSGSDSSLLLQSDGITSSHQAGNDFSRCALPGIGLHLNALAATPKGYKIVNHEASSSGRLLIGRTNFLSQTSGQLLFENTLADSLERDVDISENGILPVEDPSRESCFSKKKRLDTAVEGESCKRCNCKKSKCLKLYCECFAAGVYCVEPCACIDCFNKPIHEETVLATRKQIESRNPLAFAPKVIRGSDSSSETRDNFSKTPASARHKRGCNCKKSGCLKKYCECYQGGVGCSINCRCEGCKNTFGRKNGSSIVGMDTESEEDEMDETKKAATMETSTKKMNIPNNIEENMDSAPPTTPSTSGRQYLSNKKLPEYSFPSICSSSGFSASQGFRMSSGFFPPLPKFDQQLETVREEDIMPEFLQGFSPIKSASPNRKRVSPPQCLGMSSSSSPPGLRSSRKLILQSIPSFPSLSSNQ